MLILRFVVSYMHMIDEKQTPLPQEEKSFDQATDDVLELQRASEAARRNMQESLAEDVVPETASLLDVRRQKQRSALTKVAAGIAAGAVAAGAGAALNAANQPNFSEETHMYTFTAGEGLQHAAEDILGVENVDINEAEHHIKSDPANIDVFKDNRIDPGEAVVVPDSVE